MREREVTAAMIDCWRINYGLDKRSPADAARDWSDTCAGMAPAGAVAALGLALHEVERLQAICVAAHDRLLRGDSDQDLLFLLAAGWEQRYTVGPGEPLAGGFSTTRPGVNPITGLAWGA